MDLLTPTARVLDALVGRLGDTAFPLPERRYVTVGDIVLECTALVVSARQVTQGHPGLSQPGPVVPRGGYVQNGLEIGVAYSVCTPLPDKGMPATAVLDREGREFIFNASLLVTAMYDAYYAHDLTDPCQEATLAPVVFISEGGILAVTQTVTIQVT